MSRQIKVRNTAVDSPRERGRRLVQKLDDVVEGVGDSLKDMSLEELLSPEVFSKEQAEALKPALEGLLVVWCEQIARNPEKLEQAVKDGRITKQDADRVQEVIRQLEGGKKRG